MSLNWGMGKLIENPERPRWLDMVPVKKYEHFTLFHKPTVVGNGYYECFLNFDIESFKKGGVKNEQNDTISDL